MVVAVKFIETDQHLPCEFEETDSFLSVNFGVVTELPHDSDKYYSGAYEVTPKFEVQTLKTADRLLTKDVIIEEIPYAEVSNNAGGTTVTIG